MKGGAAGGGYAQVVPMQDINLHFNGDFHAIGAANNLLSALVDNHIYWQADPPLDTRRVHWRRVVDMNDRALRDVVVGLGKLGNGFSRQEGFDITVASEVMARESTSILRRTCTHAPHTALHPAFWLLNFSSTCRCSQNGK